MVTRIHVYGTSFAAVGDYNSHCYHTCTVKINGKDAVDYGILDAWVYIVLHNQNSIDGYKV